MALQWQIRRDTKNNWTNNNPILAEGEFGIEIESINTQNLKLKVGDGVTAWTSLQYSLSNVLSVNGQEGNTTLGTDEVAEGVSNLYFTDSRVASNPAVALLTTKNTGVNTGDQDFGYEQVNSTSDFNSLVAGNVANRNWIIAENVVLDGNKTLPTNTRLTFSRGIISGAFTLTGDNATIECGQAQAFTTDVSFGGDWNNREIYLEWWGIGTDGTVASSGVIERASTLGGTLLFPKSVLIDRKVVLSQDTYLQGVDSKTTIISSQAGALFESSCNKLTIKGFKYTAGSSNASSLLDVVGDASYLNVSDNEFVGRVNNITNYLVEVSSSFESPITITNVVMNGNVTENATIFYADFFNSDDVFFQENISRYTPRFMFRVNPPLTSVSVVKRLIIKNNECYDINGNMTLKEPTARFAQVKSLYCEIEGNILDGAESTEGLAPAANFAYIKQGTYKIFGNTVKNIKTVDSISIIDLKGTGGKIAGSTVEIYDNVFDQELVDFANTPESVIRVNQADNVSVYNNKFFNLKCFALRVYHSVDEGNYPENCSFYGNEIINIDFPVAVQVFQNSKNTSIYSNIIHEMSNTTSININARTDNRIADVYQTFNNGGLVDGVLVKDNTIYKSIGNCFLITLYKNAAAPTAGINKVKVIGNNILEGTGTGHLVRITGVQQEVDTITNLDLFNNLGFSGMAEKVGLAPTVNYRVQNNLLT